MLPKLRGLLLLLGLLSSAGRAEANSLPATYCGLASQAHVEGAAIAVFDNGAVSTIGCGKRDRAQKQPVTRGDGLRSSFLEQAGLCIRGAQAGRRRQTRPGCAVAEVPRQSLHPRRRPFFRARQDGCRPRSELRRTTAREVLSHTTGLPNWASPGPLSFTGQPGRWQYSAEGYILLQRVVERITGQPLDEWIAETVFEPLGMRHSSFIWKPAFRSNAAIGFDRSGDAERANQYPHAVAPATLYTTLDDYGLFLQRLLDGDAIGKRMMQEQTTVDRAYGLAWGLGNRNRRERAVFRLLPFRKQSRLQNILSD